MTMNCELLSSLLPSDHTPWHGVLAEQERLAALRIHHGGPVRRSVPGVGESVEYMVGISVRLMS